MYVPGIKKNLIYVSTITNNELKVDLCKYQCHIKDIRYHYMIVATGSRFGGFYKLDARKSTHHALTSSGISIEELWHQRYGHINHNDLMFLQNKSMVEWFYVIKKDHIECSACALGKQHRAEFLIHKEKIQTDLLELIHSELCGPIQT